MPKAEDWPQVGDSIFGAGKAERFHAQLDLGSWGIYPKAYFDAAELLVGAVASGSNPDVIGYPMMYLYRHYLELMIKKLIAMGRALESSADPSTHPDHHDLSALWHEARPLIEKHTYQVGQDRQDIEAVSQIIGEFARLDPTGEVFRYDVTRFDKSKGRREQTLAMPLHLSLDKVGETMKSVDGFLGGVEDVMDKLLQADVNSEFQADVNSESY